MLTDPIPDDGVSGHRLALTQAVTARLAGVVRRRGVTPATVLLSIIGMVLALVVAAPPALADACSTGNKIACENSKPGTPESVWNIDGVGDDTIQGFATQMSVNLGQTESFKIKTDAKAYAIDIYRLGYYQGNGARLIGSVTPSATLPQTQPTCISDPSTQLFDCGNWAVSGSWTVPSTAVSGVYLAVLTRNDTGGTSHIPFVVRDDSSHSDILFQTSDPTWQAYNVYGGADFYTGAGPVGRAYKISYNRPFSTRGNAGGRDFLFSNEYPAIRFMERNGYDVSYFSGVDTDRSGSLLRNHKIFTSVGHDEYWSGNQRSNVEAARDAGVNLAFFSGNEVYWRTRWEPSIDGSNTAYRTLVSYKETWSNAKVDPTNEWTGTYRDPRFTPPAVGGGQPENALTGTAYMSNDTDLAIKVSSEEGKTRLWRGTTLATQAAGATATLAPDTVGYESDEDLDNGFRPAGLIRLSTTTGPAPSYLVDFGNTTIASTTTHHLTMYRAASGALVFGAGTIQWAWGLDDSHDGRAAPADSRMQQAMINLFADMGVQPTTLMTGLVAASASTDHTAPTVTINAPAAGTTVPNGSTVTVSGSASDVGGVVAGVEVSTDGGTTWHPASGTSSWTYTYVQKGTGPSAAVQVRATDDSLNIGSPTSLSLATSCPCSVWGAAVPKTVDAGGDSAVNVGMRFTANTNGFALGVRFYKSAANTGTHTGALWSASGQLLASGTFSNETASGWQELRFSAPVDLTANTEYVVSYNAPTGHYAYDSWTYSTSDIVASPLTALRSTSTKGNGVFAYGAQAFPNQSFKDTNYGVDVLFDNRDTYPPVATSATPAPGSSSVPTSTPVSTVLSKQIVPSSLAFTLTAADGSSVSGTAAYDSTSRTATFTPTAALARGVKYTASISARDLAGNTMPTPYTWTFTTMAPDQVPYVCPCSLWNDSTVPANPTVNEAAALELGTRFTADTKGVISGVRFYKGPQNTGVHSGSLWDSAGNLLASATFTNESTSGWQSVYFSQPVSVTPGATYLVSYKTTTGFYSADWGMFATAGVTTSPLRAPVHGGAFAYGGGFPASASDANYWVDPIFTVPASMPPTIASISPSDQATGVAASPTVAVTFDATIRPGTATVTVAGPSGAVAGNVSYDPTTRVASWTPTQPLPDGTPFTVTVSGATNLGGTSMPSPFTSSFTTAGATACPCTLFPSDAKPAVLDANDGGAVTLGVKFTPSVNGFVSAVKFYKSAANTGVHTGALWSSTGSNLGTVTFTGESATGWQTATFAQPIQVTAGTTYVASYYAPNGHYSLDQHAYDSPVQLGPLTAAGGANGVNTYGSGFPTDSYLSSSYWVTPVFQTGTAPDTTPPAVTSRQPAAGAVRVDPSTAPSVTFSEPVAAGATFVLKDGQGASVAGASSYNSATKTLTFTPGTALTASATYTASVTATDLAGNTMASPDTWSFTVNGPQTCPCSLFGPAETPTAPDVSDSGGAVQLGVAFTPTTDGQISGVKFWKGPGNTGSHSGSLWSSAGQQLATGTFSNETDSGWQTLSFATPVSVTAGTTYVASYGSSSGNWSATFGQFDTAGFTWPPLSVPANAGRYVYGSGAVFPGNASGSNYWVDVVFTASGQPAAPADTTPPAVSDVAVATSGSTATVTWTTDEPSSTSVSYGTTSALGQTATGASGTSHTVTLSGLTSGATYSYRVTSADAAGNSTTAPNPPAATSTFVAPDTVAPNISTVAVATSGSTATVTWTTDESSTSSVAYGTTSALGQTATGATGTSHTVTITGLTSGATYSYRVTSADGAGNASTSPSAASTPATFVAPDTVPPTVTSVAATGSGTTATVTWTTNESATSVVQYGTSASSLTSTASGGSGTSHSVALTGLTANTRYYYRVVSADAAGNSTTSPATANAPAQYVPTVQPVSITSAADFGGGSGGYVADTAGGEVISAPSVGAEFTSGATGGTLPSTFTSQVVASGGTTTVANNVATLKGTRIISASTFGTGNSVSMAATLSANSSVGWGSTATSSTNVRAMFVVNAAGALSAAVTDGVSSNTSTAISGVPVNVAHQYRVDYASNTATFFVDGTQVAQLAFAPQVTLRAIATDSVNEATSVVVDWVRMGTYAASSTFVSKVIDAGAVVGWDTLTRDVTVPTGTSVTIQVRSGPNASPGASWTAWTTVSPTTGSITRSARYLQYQVILTTSGSRFTSSATNALQFGFHVL